MLSVFRIVALHLVLVERAFAGDDPGKVWWYRVVRSSSPFYNFELPCLVRGQSATKRDDYTYTPGIGAHKLHTRAVTWNEARITCDEEGGHLAIINSIAEANVVTEIFKNGEEITGSPLPAFVNIGYHDHFGEGQYLTVHGQTLAKAGYTQWSAGQPDNNEGAEDCGSLYKYGGLNDMNCDLKVGFMCELPIY